MKLKHLVLISMATVSCLALPGGARAAETLGSFQKANEVIGMEVKNPQDQKLGKVHDLAIDLGSGRIVEVLISSGGLAGIGERITAAPPGVFTFDPANKVLRMQADQAKFKGAPQFDTSKWAESVQTTRIAEVYRYYNQEPYFVVPGVRTSSQAVEALGNVDRASTVIGLPIKNNSAEKLGKVENLILDLRNGRVAEVIVSSGGFLGMDGELSVVPARAFQFNSGRDLLSLNASKEELKNAPHFKSSEWPDLSQPSYVGGVYSAYHIEPYFSTAATSELIGNTPDQGNSSEDLNKTAQIRKEVQAGKGISSNARNVNITTLEGRVTLRGSVATQEEKNLIRAIADRIAQPEKVDDQLTVVTPLGLN